MTQPTSTDITLDSPIKRGEQTIKSIAVRKPGSGELRGCSLVDLMRMDVTALHIVLPRITTPTLTQHDVSKLDPADLTQLGTAVTGFLLPKSAKEENFQTESSTPSQTLQ
ncbi:Phage tail assembly chaperone protein, E, or 41 or 14 [Ralstonia sp. 25mfcol4.1]|uniref:phage tail assembly protein n=1 Tax=Ralstonia sp. 25mfcol4.1 TaxID=1761899 RepID=UPI00087E2C5E|nr:phage tail assembly protein [Ralstonia sp. 25mfcol4.1]SDP45990.1 Phage tail assembly chaperone protein, E, or 41 or 14 [Ralstonia sp. 25mfcol4.1]